MLKRFLEWIGLKQKLHNAEHVPPLFKEGEIWWCYIGENVGAEVNGKSSQFTRPVLVFRKDDKFSFFAIPLSTKNKVGSWYCSFSHNGKFQNAQLSQGRIISYKRLKELIGKIDSVDYKKTGFYLATFLKNRPPPFERGRGECQIWFNHTRRCFPRKAALDSS